jgi:hypothetical protein
VGRALSCPRTAGTAPFWFAPAGLSFAEPSLRRSRALRPRTSGACPQTCGKGGRPHSRRAVSAKRPALRRARKRISFTASAVAVVVLRGLRDEDFAMNGVSERVGPDCGKLRGAGPRFDSVMRCVTSLNSITTITHSHSNETIVGACGPNNHRYPAGPRIVAPVGAQRAYASTEAHGPRSSAELMRSPVMRSPRCATSCAEVARPCHRLIDGAVPEADASRALRGVEGDVQRRHDRAMTPIGVGQQRSTQ